MTVITKPFFMSFTHIPLEQGLRLCRCGRSRRYWAFTHIPLEQGLRHFRSSPSRLVNLLHIFH